MNCNEFNLKISEYIDGELSKEQISEFLSHAQDCDICRKKLLAYQRLSKSVKICQEVIPEDFNIILPKKRNNIISLLREHEGLVSAMVAAIALMIFAGGIGSDTYKAPVMEEKEATILPSAEFSALPESEGSTPAQTAIPSVNVTIPIEEKMIETPTSPPIAESVETVPESSVEAQADVAADMPPHESDADLESDKLSGGGGGASGGSARALGGGAAMPQSENIKDTILSYNMPPKELFADEKLYNELKERLQIIKQRAISGDENIGNEFNVLITEIEKSAQK